MDAFKRALLAAKSVAYIDPAAGGPSGIYLANLFEKLGIAAEIKPKAKLKQGGYIAELIANGKVCDTCRGVFVSVKEGHPAYHRW